MADSNVALLRKAIWNRRYKAWKIWFSCIVGMAIACLLKDNLEFFKIYAMWSTIGLGALIGGLSATDIIKLKTNGN